MGQFLKFGVVGLFNTMLAYAVYASMVLSGIHYLAANAAAFVAGVLNAFYWSDRYVFQKAEDEHRCLWATLVKTFVAYGSTGLVLNSILLYILIDLAALHDLVAQLLCLGVTVPLNFLLNKFWSFKTKHHEKNKHSDSVL